MKHLDIHNLKKLLITEFGSEVDLSAIIAIIGLGKPEDDASTVLQYLQDIRDNGVEELYKRGVPLDDESTILEIVQAIGDIPADIFESVKFIFTNWDMFFHPVLSQGYMEGDGIEILASPITYQEQFSFTNTSIPCTQLEDDASLGHGYLSFDGRDDYAELPGGVGILSGDFVVEASFNLYSKAHRCIISKLNPNSGGTGSAKGWLLGTTLTGALKFYYCPSDGTIFETDGTSILTNNLDYKVRMVSASGVLNIYLSSDGGQTWGTEITVNAAGCMSALADNNTYMTVIGRGRWAAAWTDYWYGCISNIKIVKGSSDPAANPTYQYNTGIYGVNPSIFESIQSAHGLSYGGLICVKTIGG